MAARNYTTLRGSALLSALFIMTLVAIAATAMSARLQLDIYRTKLAIASDKLYLASQAPAFWAQEILTDKNRKFNVSQNSGRLLSLPVKFQNLYPDVHTTAELYDLQSRFNLNNLVNKKYYPSFFRLLESTLNKGETSQHQLLSNALDHWVSPYRPERGQDEFLTFYMNQKPSYLPGFQPLKSISEFRLVQGVNAKTYQKLLPYITVLPEPTPININTASTKVLMTLGNGLSKDQVSELLQARGDGGISDIAKITPILQKLNIQLDQITVESQYFLSVATVSSQDLKLVNYTIIKRSKNARGSISTKIVRQSLNTL